MVLFTGGGGGVFFFLVVFFSFFIFFFLSLTVYFFFQILHTIFLLNYVQARPFSNTFYFLDIGKDYPSSYLDYQIVLVEV